MTVTIQQEIINNQYVYIEQKKNESSYNVGIAESIGNYNFTELYRTVNEHVYPTLQQAKRRYSYLKRKAR